MLCVRSCMMLRWSAILLALGMHRRLGEALARQARHTAKYARPCTIQHAVQQAVAADLFVVGHASMPIS